MQSMWISGEDLLKSRITVEHFLSSSLTLIEQVRKGRYSALPISEIGKVRGGKRLPPNSQYVEEGIPYVRSTDIRDLRVDFARVVKISPQQQKVIANYPLKYHDVVIGIAGTIGTIGLVDENVGQCHFNENLARITENKINPAYLAIYLDSKYGQAYIKYLTGGAVQPKLSLASINRIEVPYLPSNLQEHIAKIIQTALDESRRKLNESKMLIANFSNELLETLGITTSNVHIEKHFALNVSDLSPKWRVENNNLRGLKEAIYASPYKVVSIGELGRFITTRYRPLGSFRYIEISNINIDTGEIDVAGLREYTPETAPTNAQRQVAQGDILISTRRPTRGAIAVVPKELDGEIATLFFSIIRLNTGSPILPEYICAYLRTHISQLQIQSAITETTYPVISDSDVARILIPVPPLDNQRHFVEEVNRRRADSRHLQVEAKRIINEAKKQVEPILLDGEIK